MKSHQVLSPFPERIRLTTLSALAAMVALPANAAVIVHNDGFTANNQPLPGGAASTTATYASNVTAADVNWSVAAGVHGVTGAPEIALLWDGVSYVTGGNGHIGGHSGNGFDTNIDWDGRGNAIQLDDRDAKAIIFTPSGPDYAVRIVSFDLDNFTGWNLGTGTNQGPPQYDWSITGSTSGLLASGSWTRDTPGRATISPEVDGAWGETLTLLFTYVRGHDSYIAMDNLHFDQLVYTATPYTEWAAAKGLISGGAGNDDPEDDPDGDGRNNLSEFAFDGNPLSGGDDGKVSGKVALVDSQPVLTLTLPVRVGAVFSGTTELVSNPAVDSVVYRIQGSENLADWDVAISEVLPGTDAEAIQSVLPELSSEAWTYRTFRVSGTTGDHSKRFIRAVVTEEED